MAVVSRFDQWQKDVFFSAAEEVQESADKVESVYRLWTRNCKDELQSVNSEELLRELRAALGTAKWQLEEFERAVKLSYESLLREENTSSRHKQFISAIDNQISRIEKELSDSLGKNGTQPLCWLQLDQEEVDDLAIFLSGPQEQRTKRDSRDGSLPPLNRSSELTNEFKGSLENYVEVDSPRKPSKINDKTETREVEQLNQQRDDLVMQDIGDWKIVIADQEEADQRAVEAREDLAKRASNLSSLSRNIVSLVKLKCFRNSFQKAKSEEQFQARNRLSEHLHLEQGINRTTNRSKNCFSSYKDGYRVSTPQILSGRISGVPKYLQGSHYYKLFSLSLRFTLLLVLSLILVGYSYNVSCFFLPCISKCLALQYIITICSLLHMIKIFSLMLPKAKKVKIKTHSFCQWFKGAQMVTEARKQEL